MKRICRYCGRDYDGDPGSSCCPDCVSAQRETTLRPRVCRACGATFLGGPRAWYCPGCREERRRQAARRHRRHGTARPLGSTDLCEICGQPYTVMSARQRYCKACAPDAIRAVDREQSKAWNRDNTTPAGRRKVRQAAAATIKCVICGKGFIPHSVAKTCSPACSAELKKRNVAAWEAAHKAERNDYRRQRRHKKKEEHTDD